ncbi:hypothetical protein GGI07_004586 [Coemansia sp. Benny D115]|nr:hypothetical protein GGI07_004586 [Coemansia sp. Benny D115]
MSGFAPATTRSYGGGQIDFGHTVPWTAEEQMTWRQLQRERDAFWDTAPNYGGRKETWQGLRMACESDDAQLAQAIVCSIGVTVPTGRIVDGVYDELGAQYSIPQLCLSAPRNIAADSLADTDAEDALDDDLLVTQAVVLGKVGSSGVVDYGSCGRAESISSAQSMDTHTAVAVTAPENQASSMASLPLLVSPLVASQMWTVHVRLSSGCGDVAVQVGHDTTIAQVERRLRASGHIRREVGRVRFMYLGKRLGPAAVPLREVRGIRHGHPAVVIQAMLLDCSSSSNGSAPGGAR